MVSINYEEGNNYERKVNEVFSETSKNDNEKIFLVNNIKKTEWPIGNIKYMKSWDRQVDGDYIILNYKNKLDKTCFIISDLNKEHKVHKNNFSLEDRKKDEFLSSTYFTSMFGYISNKSILNLRGYIIKPEKVINCYKVNDFIVYNNYIISNNLKKNINIYDINRQSNISKSSIISNLNEIITEDEILSVSLNKFNSNMCLYALSHSFLYCFQLNSQQNKLILSNSDHNYKYRHRLEDTYSPQPNENNMKISINNTLNRINILYNNCLCFYDIRQGKINQYKYLNQEKTFDVSYAYESIDKNKNNNDIFYNYIFSTVTDGKVNIWDERNTNIYLQTYDIPYQRKVKLLNKSYLLSYGRENIIYILDMFNDSNFLFSQHDSCSYIKSVDVRINEKNNGFDVISCDSYNTIYNWEYFFCE